MWAMTVSLKKVKVRKSMLCSMNIILERKILDTEFRQIIPDVDEVIPLFFIFYSWVVHQGASRPTTASETYYFE